jgi:histidinol-phosphate aminotransferase
MSQIDQQEIRGGLDYKELEQLGLSPEKILDFSTNTHSYGPSPLVRQSLEKVSIDRYPDRDCLELRRAFLTYEFPDTSLSFDSLLCGNGVVELIWAIARALLSSGSKAAILGPTFGEYALASRVNGAQVVEYQAAAARKFHLDLTEVISWLHAEQPTILWLCNPNNPTGTWLNQEAISKLSDACAHIGTTLIVDEAYWHFLTPQESFSAVNLIHEEGGDLVQKDSIIVLRCTSKMYALAGLRLGCAIASVSAIARIRRQLPFWNVNSFAQAAGITALTDRTHYSETLKELTTQRHEFFHAISSLDLSILPSRTHFFLIDVGDAHVVRQQLLKRHLLVRDCSSFGMPTYIRVATRQRNEWQQLLSALQEVVVS